jgi:hypothetical protein
LSRRPEEERTQSGENRNPHRAGNHAKHGINIVFDVNGVQRWNK